MQPRKTINQKDRVELVRQSQKCLEAGAALVAFSCFQRLVVFQGFCVRKRAESVLFHIQCRSIYFHIFHPCPLRRSLKRPNNILQVGRLEHWGESLDPGTTVSWTMTFCAEQIYMQLYPTNSDMEPRLDRCRCSREMDSRFLAAMFPRKMMRRYSCRCDRVKKSSLHLIVDMCQCLEHQRSHL